MRFLAQQYVERDGVEHALLRRLLRHLRPRQRRRRRPGAAGGAALGEPGATLPLPPGPQRAGHGARRGRLRPDAQPAGHVRLHRLDRARRDQHAHRRGAGDDQPAPGAAAARRHLRHPGRQPGAAGAGGPARLDVSVNDAFRPVSRFFDRVNRPEQLPAALLAAMRVLTDPAETGAVTSRCRRTCRPRRTTGRRSCSRKRVWHVARPVAEPAALARAVDVIRSAPAAR